MNALASRTQARSVRCPACGASAHSQCVGVRNKVRESCHLERHHAYEARRQARAQRVEAALAALDQIESEST